MVEITDNGPVFGRALPNRKWRGLEICLVLSSVALFAQFLPSIVRIWREWPSPGRQVPTSVTLTAENGQPYELRYLVYLPKQYSQQKHWPLLLYLHGSGSRGDDLNQVAKYGLPHLIGQGRHFPAIVVSPQCRANASWQTNELIALLDHIEKRFEVARDKVYTVGFSMGAYGVWALAAAVPERIAAAVPIAGSGDVTQAERLAGVRIWAFHGAQDRVVSLTESAKIIESIRAQGGSALLTVYQKQGHSVDDLVFSRDDLYEWLFKQQRVSE